MAWVRKSNLRGPRGFRGERGLPGAESLPTDEAVAAYLEAPDSVAGASLRNVMSLWANAVNVMDGFGVVGDGIEDDTAAINAAFAAVPDGGLAVIPAGEYRLTGTLTNTARSIHVSAYGARFIQDGVNTAVQFDGIFNPSVEVSGITVTDITDYGQAPPVPALSLTVPGLLPWKRGDVVKMWADNVMPDSQWDVPSPAAQSGRVGQFFTVYAVSGAQVILLGKLRDPMTSGIRVSKVEDISTSWRGGEFESVSEVTASSMMRCSGLRSPVVEDVLISNSMGMSFSFASCYGYTISNCESRWSQNNPEGGAYGYGVDDNASEYGLVLGCRFHQPRHGFTSTASTSAVGQDSPFRHGRTYGTRVVDCMVTAALSAAFDTHSNAVGVTFDGCEANNSPTGFQLRGNRNRVVNSVARDVNIGVRLSSDANSGESWGHVVENFLVDGCSNRVVEHDTRHGASHPRTGELERRPSYVRNLTARGVSNQGLFCRNVTLHADNVEIDYTTVMSTGQHLNRVINSTLRVGYQRLGLEGIGAGAGAGVCYWITGESIFEVSQQLRINGFSQMRDRVSQFIVTDNVPVLRVDDMLADYALDSGLVYQSGPGAGWVNYRYAVGTAGDTSMWGDLTSATSSDALGRVIANSFSPLTAVRFTLPGNQTLAQMPFGRRGQTVLLINTSASANLTVVHGTTPRVLLNGGANRVLTPGQSLMLTFEGSAWRQVTPV